MELIDRQALKDYVSSLSTNPLNGWSTWGVLSAIDRQPTIHAPLWNRVEEPPKKTAKYLVWVDVNNGVFAAYPELRTAAYNVVYERWYVDGDQRTEWIGTPRYWMPIEPPKEEEHGN